VVFYFVVAEPEIIQLGIEYILNRMYNNANPEKAGKGGMI
jgi:hypothetical protein